VSKTLIIAKREYFAFVKTIGFWLSLVTFPLIMAVAGLLPILLSSKDVAMRVGVLDISGVNLEAELVALIKTRDPNLSEPNLPEAIKNTPSLRSIANEVRNSGGLRYTELPPSFNENLSLPSAEAKLSDLMKAEAPSVDAVILAYRTQSDSGAPQLGFHLWSKTKTRGDLEATLRRGLNEVQFKYGAKLEGIDPIVAQSLYDQRPIIESLTPDIVKAPVDGAASFAATLKQNGPRFFGIAMSYLTWMAIFTSAVVLLTGVVEEKASKVIEVLLTSASSHALIVGKVLAVGLVNFTVMAVWGSVLALAAIYGFAFIPQDVSAQIAILLSGIFTVTNLILFSLYFVGGFLMYGVVFTAMGAFCETQKDAQTIMGPVVLVLFIPVLALQSAMFSPNVEIIRYLSWVPFFTPFLMPLRITDGAGMWEIAATLLGMGVTAYIAVRIGSRAFMQGALTGGKFSWRGLFSAIKP
jgi:ABC-2 type transport system permease protein